MSEPEEEPESDVVYFNAFEIPDGFRLVELGNPPAFLSAGEIESRSVYMLLCVDDLSWVLGKIVKYKPRAKKINFDVQWSPDVDQHQGVQLAKYYSVGTAPEPGHWVYIERAGSERRTRDDDNEQDDDDDITDDGRASRPSPASRPRSAGGTGESEEA